MQTSSAVHNVILPDWPAPAQVRAVSSLRHGGCSEGIFQSFNLGDHVNDNPEHVLKNRQLFKQLADMPQEPLWLQQVHGIVVARPDLACSYSAAPVKADAAYSCALQRVCVVMTADCLPLLLCDRAGKEVAAIHAGWRGLAAGVIEQTLRYFQAKPEDIMVWLGPAIGPQAFEVGSEVRAAFINAHPAADVAFKLQSSGKYLADLYLLARIRLVSQGITAIYGGNYCTYQQAEHFFSYRRDGQTGRMASAIWLDTRS